MIKYLPFFILILFVTCTKEDLSFEIGSKYVDRNMNILYTDTVSIDSYTVRWDSLATSGYYNFLVGYAHDSVFGDVHSKSYLQVSRPILDFTVPADAVFDSLEFQLLYNNYSFGDTTKPLTINIHRLKTSPATRKDGSLYNTSSFDYFDLPYGTATFLPRPHGTDSVKIVLQDELGSALFNAIKDKDEIISDQSSFQDFLRGFVIDADSTSSSLVGFRAVDSIPVMKLYFHSGDIQIKRDHIEFDIYTNTTQFNQISLHGSEIILPAEQTDKRSALETGGTSFIQAGTGIFTRVEIPYLKNLLELGENIKVLQARLVLEPIANSYTPSTLPPKLSIYATNPLNQLLYPLYDAMQNIQVADLDIDYIFQKDTRYTFDITDFLDEKINEQTGEIPSLLICVSTDDLYYTVDRLVLGSRWHPVNKITLKIYLMKYE